MSTLAQAKALADAAWGGAGKWESNMQAALVLLQEAVQADPSNIALHTALGVVLCDLAKYKEASQVLRRAVSLGSTDRNTHFALAVAMFNTSGHKSDMRLFREAAKLVPSPETWGAYFDPQAQ